MQEQKIARRPTTPWSRDTGERSLPVRALGLQLEIGYGETVEPISEELLERSSMGILPELEAGFLDDDLLICPACQERLRAGTSS